MLVWVEGKFKNFDLVFLFFMVSNFDFLNLLNPLEQFEMSNESMLLRPWISKSTQSWHITYFYKNISLLSTKNDSNSSFLLFYWFEQDKYLSNNYRVKVTFGKARIHASSSLEVLLKSYLFFVSLITMINRSLISWWSNSQTNKRTNEWTRVKRAHCHIEFTREKGHELQI